MHNLDDLVEHIRRHRCSSHPIFQHWARVDPEPVVLGALFHQIQLFCASTRPGARMPEALDALGFAAQAELVREIVASESGHGPELATMAGYVLNRRSGRALCPDVRDQGAVEALLRRCSDALLAALPGYDRKTGLTPQAARAIAVFARRELVDRESTLRNVGTALALEMISNRQLIPGEKHCLVDSGLYGVRMEDPEMHYLLEHFGECGAECQHERNAIDAAAALADTSTLPFQRAGADEFLEALAALWDVLDAALLGSGIVRETRRHAAAG